MRSHIIWICNHIKKKNDKEGGTIPKWGNVLFSLGLVFSDLKSISAVRLFMNNNNNYIKICVKG